MAKQLSLLLVEVLNEIPDIHLFYSIDKRPGLIYRCDRDDARGSTRIYDGYIHYFILYLNFYKVFKSSEGTIRWRM